MANCVKPRTSFGALEALIQWKILRSNLRPAFVSSTKSRCLHSSSIRYSVEVYVMGKIIFFFISSLDNSDGMDLLNSPTRHMKEQVPRTCLMLLL